MALAAASVLVLAVSYTALYHVEAVGQKVEKQYRLAKYGEREWEITRMGTFLSDLRYVRARPLFGWGLHQETRYALDGGHIIWGQGNGLSDFAAKFGLVGLLTYLVCVWHGAWALGGWKPARGWFVLLFVMAVLNGEALLNYPLFLGLMFLQPYPFGRKPIAAPGRYPRRRTAAGGLSKVDTLGPPMPPKSVRATEHTIP